MTNQHTDGSAGRGDATGGVRERAGVGDLIVSIAVLALVAIIAFFQLNQSRSDALRAREAVASHAIRP